MRKVILFLLMLLPTVADAALFDFEVDGIYYKISDGSEVSVARTYYGNDYSGNVAIPSSVTYNGTTYSVTSIGQYAFYNCTGLTSISIPNSITSINDIAFKGCSSLDTVYISDIAAWCNIYFNYSYGNYYANPLSLAEHLILNGVEMNDLTIPDSVTAIGDCAFYHFKGLKSITIGNAVTTIGNFAFTGCSGLTNVTIPNSVTTIGDYAFDSSGLTSLTIPNSVTSIGVGAFAACISLTSIDIPNSITTISTVAFSECSGLTSVTIPNSVTSIGDRSFYLCSGLTDITIGNSVVSIGNEAFYDCHGLPRLTIPKSVTNIGDKAFVGCSSLTSIIVESGNQDYDSRNNCNAIVESSSNTLIFGCKKTVIPNTITAIGNYAFMSCSGLTNINIPSSVTLIGHHAFLYCFGLSSIDIPNSVTSIGDEAFKLCSYLANVNIGNSVTSIGDQAFSGCENLYNVTIPNSVIHIGNGAFNNCNGISTLMITGEGEWTGGTLFENSRRISHLIIDSRITSVKGMKVYPYSVYSYSIIPPTCDDNSFIDYSGTLHVPASSLAAYFTADYWCNFANIVGDAVELDEVIISQDSVEVNLGNLFNLTATLAPSNDTFNNDISWQFNSDVVRIIDGYDNSYTFEAVGVGECDIIVKCLNKKAICHIVVNDTTVTITLDQQEAMLLPNHMLTLTPIPNPIVPDLLVTSSDPSVAAARVVNNKIQVVGIKEGTTTITVGSVDGTAIPATCLVTVYTEPGDLDCDGFLNISDVTSLIDYLLSGDNSQISTKNADVNDDGSINISDVTTLIDTLLSGNG